MINKYFDSREPWKALVMIILHFIVIINFVEIDVHNSPQTASKSIDNYFFLSHFRETKNGTPTNSQVEL